MVTARKTLQAHLNPLKTLRPRPKPQIYRQQITLPTKALHSLNITQKVRDRMRSNRPPKRRRNLQARARPTPAATHKKELIIEHTRPMPALTPPRVLQRVRPPNSHNKLVAVAEHVTAIITRQRRSHVATQCCPRAHSHVTAKASPRLL